MNQTIQILQTTPQQLQSEINAGVKIILAAFLKKIESKKHKKQLLRRKKEKLEKILPIVQIAAVLIHLVELSLLQNNYSIIITFMLQVISFIKL